ncbi:hypothetical protein PC116_g25053 [Phytophthora cactorum]|uniref:Uncharacterized protein n=1 Tax=Phytophthora cactorum TaxID=29920 RepID=A0A8T0Y2C5_9STRA|nr:hypothetical protein Pcac1_g25624 [Phytophthora cactorum]KAG2799470.1 hypothetical protein PC111_g20419 [Phytophthora cactorum]KAG2831800.1 hypothetical protein PC113_g20872 [Phytophthora cactorum]KAG2896862.1 hypothetical protein PC117_g22900 [Phytophthora cactorum]KAG2974196.1 hypothetical protein PC119_g22736 [Phytophthora cactorum]
MDACDVGLCALDSSSKETLTYQFNDQVRQQISDFKSGDANGFDKNFRELLSCPLRHSCGANPGHGSLPHPHSIPNR